MRARSKVGVALTAEKPMGYLHWSPALLRELAVEMVITAEILVMVRDATLIASQTLIATDNPVARCEVPL